MFDFLKKKAQLDLNRIPEHLAIIMDGNGRWAKRRGLPRNIGHREGSITLKKIVEYCSKIGVKHLTVYAFSTENWKRPQSEVDALMSLLMDYLKNADKELSGKNIRIRVLGCDENLSEEMKQEIKRVMIKTSSNDGLNLNIALNYGARNEIIRAVKDIGKDIKSGRLKIEDIDDKLFSNKLFTADIPDPDLVIRTSGEFRISNFMLWQSAYSEYYFTDTLWPDFTPAKLEEAILEYQNRDRRFGGI